MLKRYANVQVLLFSALCVCVPPPPPQNQLTALLSEPKPNTEGGRKTACERERARETEREFGCLFFRGMDDFVRTAPGYLI